MTVASRCDPVKYLVYLVYDPFPIFVWAHLHEAGSEFHVFVRDGNYIASFPVHVVKEIKKETDLVDG